jgi:hypothetical protein
MIKTVTLITAAVLSFGLASASMAADPATGDTASTSAPKAKKHSASHKHSAKKKSSTTTASTK